MNALGRYLRDRCKELGLTSSELARRSGKSRQTILSAGTHGGGLPAIETLVQLALVLKVHPLRLMQLVFEDLELPARQQQAYRQRGDKSAFVADVTIPDGHPVMVGSTFTKTWAVQNVGSVPWEDRYLNCMDDELLVMTKSGERLVVAQRLRPTVQQVAVPYTAPGAIVELSVDFRAPDAPGTCVSYWKSHHADGRLCFPKAVGLSCCVSVISSRAAGDELG
ncbi:NBR1-Ig-like domain-containing protein [Rubrivivax rivuli]|uniref:Helix-turn-helix domain-containing protein n=1 Tax=Rubrivivax rivuli TaxID=1862385 RepID=A0A437RAC3_9BURK|nr:NBR1-Ig-like domain-containing protein [Rubrivivax rivuli]RVU43756.1 helix-turn-helix domain-containing protein [Rubrivivax rivuli]